LRRLVPHFDVLAENFKAGAMEKMGLGYSALAELHPPLVYVSISGFGHLAPTPYSDWPAYAPIAEAMAGLYEPTRRPGEPPPVVVAGALGDNASALYALIGTLAALRQRERTGRGQHVDIAMFDAMVAMTDMVPFMWSVGEPPSAATAGRTGLVNAFAASDGYFVMAIFRDHQFEKLAQLVGQPGWIGDPRFATREGWAAHRESVVRPALEAWARDLSKLEASRRLAEQGDPGRPQQPRGGPPRRSARGRARHADRGAARRRSAPDARLGQSREDVGSARGSDRAAAGARRAHRRGAARSACARRRRARKAAP
jgi:crotonobetainyl-CoA:carnitine CoA-transferase CaiB-like acyl-CoA transferase